MNIHKNARLTPLRREEMARDVVEGRLSKAQSARTYGVTPKVVKRWVERFEADGRAGMADRSSRPATCPKTTQAAVAERIVALRRQRFTGSHIANLAWVRAAMAPMYIRLAPSWPSPCEAGALLCYRVRAGRKRQANLRTIVPSLKLRAVVIGQPPFDNRRKASRSALATLSAALESLERYKRSPQ